MEGCGKGRLVVVQVRNHDERPSWGAGSEGAWLPQNRGVVDDGAGPWGALRRVVWRQGGAGEAACGDP